MLVCMETVVARRTDDWPAKRMVRAAGWREDLMYALREEGDVRGLLRPSLHRSISIHALREEGVPAGCTASCPVWNCYPRPPPGGRRRWRYGD